MRDVAIANTRVGIQGTVEVVRNGTVFGVCDYGWDDRDAAVVCASVEWTYVSR